ncbi:hypothetical protein SOCE26_079390 [Sorangium cellulosum]|uniref:Uncharacterized protein n=1 Tax=Sorangium cellulosum TaxID=56 RepID=A0A2L0F4G0_SORCE|nr:hypothetical protein [Sorangium cellulosum]AUX46433.1 hypothetical protein SOCE26_079390 [Sorangium cellulosum]
MRQVLRHIFKKKQAYARLPLFERIRDERLDPLERLAFYPCMASFILSFGDLNRFVLREEHAADKYQEMVNVHTHEDDHHWPWYLEDLAKLGFDIEAPGSDWMNFLWGEETLQNRILMARLTALIKGTTGLERLVIIEAIEETGNVLFGAMLPVAEALEKRLGTQLRYCGPFHFERESGHTVDADHAALASIPLDAETTARYMALADEVFAMFEPWTHELLSYALAHPVNAPMADLDTDGESQVMVRSPALRSSVIAA